MAGCLRASRLLEGTEEEEEEKEKEEEEEEERNGIGVPNRVATLILFF